MVPAADRPVTGTGVERHSPHPGVELLALRIDQARPGKRPDHGDQPPKIITANPINARPPIPLPRSTVPPDSAVQPTLCKPDRPETLDICATALRQDLHRCFTRPDGSLEVNEGWRTMPYLSDGSVGIGMVLDEYLVHRDDERFAAATAGIRRAALSPLYVEPGLFHGRAGMILHLSRPHPPGTAAERDCAVAAQLRRLAWHAIDYRDGVAFPGEELLRLSMDLATGTAGVLLAAGAALHSEPVSLPFLAPTMSVPTHRTRPARTAIRR